MKNRERRYDDMGPVVLMAWSDSYVMVRRPGCIPFVLHFGDWEKLPRAARSAAEAPGAEGVKS